MQSLVIGYGNSLRSDDGVGIRVAEIVADWNLPQVRSIAMHQLTPELAADIAEADTVIFVDAVAANSDHDTLIQLHPLQPDLNHSLSGHYGTPQSLLALAQTLYNSQPSAYWILIPVTCFELGENLSSIAQVGIDQSIEKIKDLLRISLFC